MSNLTQRLAALFVSAAIVFTIGSAWAEGENVGGSVPAASGYVQKNLVMHLDGIDNQGTGVHVPDATSWKDLSGNGFDMTLTAGNCEWDALGLHLLGKGICGSPTTKTAEDFKGKIKTIEVVYCNERPKATTVIFATGMGREAYVYTHSNGRIAFGGTDKVTPNGSGDVGMTTNSFSAVYAQIPETVSSSAFNGLSSLYVGSTKVNPVAAGDYWGVGGVGIGKDPAQNRLYATGILMAIRIYDRELTDDERIQNALLDTARFGALDRRPRAMLNLQASDGGLISLNGGEFVKSISSNMLVGAQVSIATKADSDAKFLWWKRSDVAGFQRQESIEDFAMPAENRSFTAFFRSLESPGDARLTRYTTEGLLAWYDGLANDGVDQAQNQSATAWKDLVAGNDLVLNQEIAEFTTNSLSCNGGTMNAKAAKAITGIGTIEVVMDVQESGTHMIFSSGSNNRMIATYKDPSILGASGSARYRIGTESTTFTFTYQGNAVKAFFEGGTEKNLTVSADSWNMPSDCFVGGKSDNYGFNGQIYAIRLYDRVLSDMEIAANAIVDGVRFFGLPDSDGLLVDAAGDGLVRIGDGEPAVHHELHPEIGEELVLTALPAEGQSFVSWQAEGLELTVSNRFENPLKLTYVPTIKSVSAYFAPEDGPVAEVRNYSYDGIVGFWDGIVNEDFHLPHSNDARQWKNLVGFGDFPLIEGNAQFTNNALVCRSRKNGNATGSIPSLGSIRTVEVLCGLPSSGWSVVLTMPSIFLMSSSAVQLGGSGALHPATTNQATYAFVYTKERGWVFFENGAEITEENYNDNSVWNDGSALILGARDGAYPYVGDIHAVRLYNRALSSVELVHNSDVDQQRFFGCAQVEADRGYRISPSGTVEWRLHLDVDKGGKVVYDGMDLQSSDIWIADGTTVSLTAKSVGACSFAGWVDDARAAIQEDQAYSETVVFTMTHKTSIRAAFVKNRLLRGAGAKDYVRNGLTMQLDAIENVALGAAHDAETNVWHDLSGNGRDWAINLDRSEWLESGLHLRGIGAVGVPTDDAPAFTSKDVVTVELVYANEVEKNADTLVFSPGIGVRAYFYTDKSGRFGYFSSPYTGNYVARGVANRFSVTYGITKENVDKMFVNGAVRLNEGMDTYWDVSESRLIGGRESVSSPLAAQGKLMTIRVYNRVLTRDERIFNAKLDGLRFCGERLPTGMVVRIR